MSEPMKRCTMCRQQKPYSQFTLNKATGKPKNSRCKPCHAAAEYARRKALPRRESGQCADCGTSLSGRGPQALVCEPCAKARRRQRGSRTPLTKRRDAAAVLPYLEQGKSQLEACQAAGISWATLRRRVQADPEFAGLVDAAWAEGKAIRLRPCGTYAKYDRGCRCEECRAAKNEQTSRWRKTVRKRTWTEADQQRSREHRERVRKVADSRSIPHGLTGRLNYLCKCEVCMAAGREASMRWQKERNAELLGQAKRHNAQWTGPELEIAAREDLSASQVAEMLGRTLWAVMTMRKRMRVEPSQQWLAGHRSRLH